MRNAIGEKYRDQLEEALTRVQADILWLPDNPDLDPRLSGHADLNVYYEDGALWVAEGITSLIANYLTEIRQRPYIINGMDAVYPKDVPLCACPVGKYLFCNPDTIEESIPRKTKRTVIAVHQGYTRCSICVVSEEAIITSDRMIAYEAKEHGLDVLTITPGHIRLDGFNEGFIGGSVFQISDDGIALTGHLHGHPDETAILDFLEKHGKKPVYLTNSPIFDIGGGVALP